MEIAFSVAIEQLSKGKKRLRKLKNLLSKDKKQLSKVRNQVSKHTEVLLLAKKLSSNSKFLVSTTVEAIIL